MEAHLRFVIRSPHQGRSVEYALEAVVEMTAASAVQHHI